MIAHRAHAVLPLSRALTVQVPDGFAPGPVEVIVLGLSVEVERPADVASGEMTVEEFRAVFPRIPALCDGARLDEDPTEPLDPAIWGKLAG